MFKEMLGLMAKSRMNHTKLIGFELLLIFVTKNADRDTLEDRLNEAVDKFLEQGRKNGAPQVAEDAAKEAAHEVKDLLLEFFKSGWEEEDKAKQKE